MFWAFCPHFTYRNPVILVNSVYSWHFHNFSAAAIWISETATVYVPQQQQQHATFLTCCQRIFFEVDETQLVSCLKKKKGHGHGQKHIEK